MAAGRNWLGHQAAGAESAYGQLWGQAGQPPLAAAPPHGSGAWGMFSVPGSLPPLGKLRVLGRTDAVMEP